jgi:hypothetical protein
VELANDFMGSEVVYKSKARVKISALQQTLRQELLQVRYPEKLISLRVLLTFVVYGRRVPAQTGRIGADGISPLK